MLFVCIPTHNEAQTVGLVLWRIRKVLADFPREYELLVYDDGSTDATSEVLRPYTEVLPLTVLGGAERVGYARAIDALLRAATTRCRYPRRDAVILMQADLTDRPEQIPDLVKRFEGGADIVVGEPGTGAPEPVTVRRFRRIARWITKTFARVPGVADPLGSFRLLRVTVLRDAIRSAGEKPVVGGKGWAVNLDLLQAMVPHARRVETVVQTPQFDLRPRESRVRPIADAFQLLQFSRSTKSRRPQLRLAEPG